VASRLQPSDIIYTDYRTAPDLIFFRTGRLLRSDTNTIRWDNVDPKELPKGAYVLVNWPILDFEKQAYNVKIPAFASNPPSVWTKVQSFDNADLYLVPRWLLYASAFGQYWPQPAAQRQFNSFPKRLTRTGGTIGLWKRDGQFFWKRPDKVGGHPDLIGRFDSLGSVVTSLAGFAGDRRPQLPEGRTPIPAALR